MTRISSTQVVQRVDDGIVVLVDEGTGEEIVIRDESLAGLERAVHYFRTGSAQPTEITEVGKNSLRMSALDALIWDRFDPEAEARMADENFDVYAALDEWVRHTAPDLVADIVYTMLEQAYDEGWRQACNEVRAIRGA